MPSVDTDVQFADALWPWSTTPGEARSDAGRTDDAGLTTEPKGTDKREKRSPATSLEEA